jgi:regulator of protease activity HflC (stomatin/prohibitin superfamily)
MSVIAWIIVLVIVLPMIGLLAWVVLSASFVRIRSGRLGLLLVRGKATDTTLPPGSHFVFAFRRRMVEEYPSVELTYRAGAAEDAPGSDLERSGPALRVALGDRATATVPYTVRFRLLPDTLRGVHERFGPEGIFGIVRDESSRAITSALGDPSVTVEDMFGPAREKCQDTVGAAVDAALQEAGIELTGFLLGAVDLGRTGDVIQATMRARHELDQEQAEAATRLARAANDADLQLRVTSSSSEAWRYRESELLRDILQRTEALQVAVHGAGLGGGVPGTGGSQAQPQVQPQTDEPPE